MDKTEIEKRRHEMLEALNTELNEEQIAAVVRQEEGMPEMVSALLDELGDEDMEIVGDFYFRPMKTDEDGAQIFMSVITISDELPQDRLAELYEAIAYVNFTLPAGCFSIDKDHRVFCYVLNAMLPMALSDDAVYKTINLAVGNTFAIVDSYIGILCDVIDGTIDADGVVEFLGGPAEA